MDSYYSLYLYFKCRINITKKEFYSMDHKQLKLLAAHIKFKENINSSNMELAISKGIANILKEIGLFKKK